MTRRFCIVLLTLFVVVVAGRDQAFPHEGHPHKVLGTVTTAASDHVMLKDKDGKDVTVFLTKDTKVLRAKKPMKVDDIKTGMRVVVTAVMQKERMMATTIELGPAPTAK